MHGGLLTHWIFNHVVQTSSICFKNANDLNKIQLEKWVIVSYPWLAPNLVFSGIPPYCSLLQHILEVRLEQKGKFTYLIFNFYKFEY
jgi:hypothetical protein